MVASGDRQIPVTFQMATQRAEASRSSRVTGLRASGRDRRGLKHGLRCCVAASVPPLVTATAGIAKGFQPAQHTWR